jgi:hypothetical protein
MNHIETSTVIQQKTELHTNHLSRDLRQAVKVINAEYQQIDWEDQTFLNRVLTDALNFIETEKGTYAAS